MKFFLLVLALCFAGTLGALSDEQVSRLKAYEATCLGETGAEADVVKNAKNGQIPEADDKFKCFSACMLKKIGVMTPDGLIDANVLRSKIPADIPKEKVDELVNKCANLGGATECETGFKYTKCVLETKSIKVF